MFLIARTDASHHLLLEISAKDAASYLEAMEAIPSLKTDRFEFDMAGLEYRDITVAAWEIEGDEATVNWLKEIDYSQRIVSYERARALAENATPCDVKGLYFHLSFMTIATDLGRIAFLDSELLDFIAGKPYRVKLAYEHGGFTAIGAPTDLNDGRVRFLTPTAGVITVNMANLAAESRALLEVP